MSPEAFAKPELTPERAEKLGNDGFRMKRELEARRRWLIVLRKLKLRPHSTLSRSTKKFLKLRRCLPTYILANKILLKMMRCTFSMSLPPYSDVNSMQAPQM